MEKVSSRQIWFAAVCFVMFAVTVYFLLEAMDVFSGEYDKEMLPVIVYYTIQTNIFAAVWMLYLALEALISKMPRLSTLLSMFVTLYLTITCVVYWAMLVPMLGFDAKLFSLSNIWMHTAVPVFAVAVFFFVLRGARIGKRQLGLIIVYPLLYLVMAYVLRSTTGAYVYPFFNPVAMRGGFGVALSLFVIAALFIGLAVLFRLAWNKRCMRRGQGEEKSARE
ncbi:MAG: hypothetical protein HN948_06905 [Clostridia bacterium]|jgi:hypothetical protein|nr:hypothetical protein [Clostridia bacterium]MBT7122721.1 hypothetical protein [Clostridia bacterium]